MRNLCDEAKAEFGCQIALSSKDSGFTQPQPGRYEFHYSVSIFGATPKVLAARSFMLRRNPTQVCTFSLFSFGTQNQPRSSCPS
jgi:hypothetical protein